MPNKEPFDVRRKHNLIRAMMHHGGYTWTEAHNAAWEVAKDDKAFLSVKDAWVAFIGEYRDKNKGVWESRLRTILKESGYDGRICGN